MPLEPSTPLSPLPFTGFSVTVAVGAVVELDPAPFNNTKEVVINNLSSTDSILAQVAVVFPAVPVIGALTTATVIPASSSFSFCIGSEGNRNPLGTLAYWNGGAFPGTGSLLNIVVGVPAGAASPADINITYIQCAGGGGKIGGC